MSTAEPFMPAHRPPPPPPNAERDIDHDTDVVFAEPDAEADARFDPHGHATSFRRPSPGQHMTREELATDFPEESVNGEEE